MKEAKIEEILAPVPAEIQQEREERVRSKFWSKARKVARRIPFMDEVVAAYFAALDTKTPTRVKGMLLAALAYFILPLDTIPDFFAIVGFTDDIAVLTAAIALAQSHITDEHRQKAREALAGDITPAN